MADLQSRLVISADDQTAAAFAAVQARIGQLQASISAVDQRASAFSVPYAPAPTTGPFAPSGAALKENAAAIAAQTKAIEAQTASMAAGQGGLVNTLVGGAAALGAGLTGIASVQQAFDQAHEAERMAAAGMSAEEIADSQRLAGEIAHEYPSILPSQALALARNTRATLGSYEEARRAMGDIASAFVVAQESNVAAGPEELTAEFEQLIKGAEIKGATQDPKEFHALMEGIAKGLNAFGDTLKPTDYYEMIKYARQAGLTLSTDFMVSVAPSIAQAMRGSSAGRAFSDFSRAIVGGHMEHDAFRALADWGLIAPEDLDYTKTGAIKGLKPGSHVQGWELAASNPYLWVKDVLKPALAAHGVDVGDKDQVAAATGRIFTNQYAAQLAGIFATQGPRIEKDIGMEAGAKGLASAAAITKEDPEIAAKGLLNAIKSFGASLVPTSVLTPVLSGAAQMFEAQANRPPELQFNRSDVNRMLFGQTIPERDRAELMARYGQTGPPDIRDIERAPSRHTLGEAGRVQEAISADREAARGAALMALPAPPAPSRHTLGEAGRVQEAIAADREAARGAALMALPAPPAPPGEAKAVAITGAASVDQTLHIDISLDPGLRAELDHLQSSSFSVPLDQAQTGRMDSDAAPMRGGIGHQ